jgi:dihydrofolate reductase
MPKLTFFGMMISLDGYINDAKGDFDWGQIDKNVHEHANAETRRVGTMVLGRRMYETLFPHQSMPGVGASVSVPSALRDCLHAQRTG